RELFRKAQDQKHRDQNDIYDHRYFMRKRAEHRLAFFGRQGEEIADKAGIEIIDDAENYQQQNGQNKLRVDVRNIAAAAPFAKFLVLEEHAGADDDESEKR